MDLWDLTRLLFRRWYIALPILLTSLLTAALVGQSVKPDYRSTGNVVVIPAPGPPTSTATPAPGEKTPPKNPWADLGLEALGNAAILKVLDQKALKSLADAGLSDSITVQMTPRTPILYVEAVGTSPAQATATVREVIRLLIAEVAEQQRRFDVLPQDTITTLTLTDGADVAAVTSKAKRVLIVIVGLGLLITAGGTIGLDVLLRRRRGVGRVEADGADGESRREIVSRVSGERRADVPHSAAVADATEAVGRRRFAPAGQQPAVPSRPPRVAGMYRGQEQPGAGGERRAGANSNGPAEGIEYVVPQAKPTSASMDKTVILPPTRSQRIGREDRNGGR
ncbi:hypothetical protein OG470_18890 [Micromonospora sp. NBC_00389]|uniref:hypothetical protein n=1 Tax=Micromonospora sp. NBC_00389 TaxID=2903586 RepID=UPI002E1CB52A